MVFNPSLWTAVVGNRQFQMITRQDNPWIGKLFMGKEVCIMQNNYKESNIYQFTLIPFFYGLDEQFWLALMKII
jgi:membrane-anchored protein YejM (alkaline phosphatase superfamily)